MDAPSPVPPAPTPVPPVLPADPAALLRVLGKFLDEQGVPRRAPVGDWWVMLTELDRLRRANKEPWPDDLLEMVRGLVLATLRFSRPDGSGVLAPGEVPSERASVLRRWAEVLDDPALGKISRWWFGRRGARLEDHPPPLPSFGAIGRPLAMLRADWLARGDFVAIDHREPGSSSAIEVQALGKTLLGPGWSVGDGGTSKAKLLHYRSSPMADWSEWSFPHNGSRIIRTAVFLRCRQLALLADEWHGGEALPTSRVVLAAGISASSIKDSRAIALKGKGVSARVIPLGLPALPYTTERGSFTATDDELVLRQRAEARRTWLPLLISWDKDRNRRVATWRMLTVTQKSKICPPGVAFAARVAWGPGDGLVIYRSLARPSMRTFLGHQTSARFLIGTFDANGNVSPLLKVD